MSFKKIADTSFKDGNAPRPRKEYYFSRISISLMRTSVTTSTSNFLTFKVLN